MSTEEKKPVLPGNNPSSEENTTAGLTNTPVKAVKNTVVKKRKPHVIAIAVILAVVIAFSAFFGVIGAVTKGESIDCKSEAEKYNSSRPDASHLYRGATKAQLNAEITRLNDLIAQAIGQFDINSALYSDEGMSRIGKLLGQYSGKEFGEVNFRSLKKDYPDAHALLNDMQLSSASWEHIQVIPFGIEKGDKEAFIKACGAFGKFLGDEMISMALKAPSAYDDALVPLLEALHTGPMPSLIGFVLETGLDGSKRVEFLVEKALSVIEPLKEAPIDYLCTMLPDFLVNFKKASEYINSRDLGIRLPDPQVIVSSLWELLGMTNKPVDLEYLASLGTAEIAESGINKGQRVEIKGDRDDVFMFISDYIDQHVTYENNYEAMEKLLTQTLKEIDRNSEAGRFLYGDTVDRMLALYVKIVAMNKIKVTNTDAEALVSEHNAQTKDTDTVFEGFMNRESVARVMSTLDSTLASFMAENKIENILFTDSIATAFTKITAQFCGIDFGIIPFDAMSYSFPDAYSYVKALQSEGKTWDDIGVIPFGITPGDMNTFIRACGAGGEYFGDLLALNMVVAPTIYDEGFIAVSEAFHLGASPDVEEFIIRHGADGALIIEVVLEIVVKSLEPLKKAPVSYLCTILPDLIYGYGVMADCAAANPDTKLTGLELPPLGELLSSLLSESGIVLPEFDFSKVVALSQAAVAESGDRTGKRMELTGDKEAVFAYLTAYVMSIINHENNVEAISTTASNLFGINAAILKGLFSTFRLILG